MATRRTRKNQRWIAPLSLSIAILALCVGLTAILMPTPTEPPTPAEEARGCFYSDGVAPINQVRWLDRQPMVCLEDNYGNPTWFPADSLLVTPTSTPATATETPTPTPTPTPTEPPAAAAATLTTAPSRPTPTPTAAEFLCTEAEFEGVFGFWADQIGEEACAFHWWDWNNPMLIHKPCPTGWLCTIGVVENDGTRTTYVYVGDESVPPLKIYGATWRWVAAYPETDEVHSPCAFLKKVQEEGRNSDPPWEARPANFSCQ